MATGAGDQGVGEGMRPYFHAHGIIIYHGDCRDILPQLRYMPVLITDPVWPNCPAGLLAGADDPYGLFADMFAGLSSCLPRRLVVILRNDCDPRFLAAVPDALPYFNTQILPYVMPGYFGRKMGGDELAYCFGEPISSSDGQRVIPGRGPAVQPGGRAANGHPCSRALQHFRWLVRWWSEEDEMILDPFCGSGTTLRAAQELGRKAVGIEIEERYCELAARRIEQQLVMEFA